MKPVRGPLRADSRAVFGPDRPEPGRTAGRQSPIPSVGESQSPGTRHKCCIAAFPNTLPGGWYVDDVEAPASGGHCRIDPRYDVDVPGYDWAFSEAVQDRYHPFLRVTNSYNISRVFSIHCGSTRIRCMDSVIANE